MQESGTSQASKQVWKYLGGADAAAVITRKVTTGVLAMLS